MSMKEELITVRIGKRGISSGVIRELRTVLKKRGIVKVKLLKNFRESSGMNRWEVAKLLSEKLKAKIVEVRGFTVLLKLPEEHTSGRLRSQNRKFLRKDL